MEKRFENALDNDKNYSELKKAIIKWVLGTDGENGGTIRILEQIPWSDDMNNMVPFEEYEDKFDEAIGARGCWDVCKLVGTDLESNGYRKMFFNVITEKAAKIYGVYADAINTLNMKYEELNRKCCVIKNFVGVDGLGFCKYEITKRFYASTYCEAIHKVWDYILANGLNTGGWTFGGFVDAMYKPYSSVSLGNGYSCHMNEYTTTLDFKIPTP